jgi:hypothetical protein
MANVPISNLTTTWNNVATTFTGIKLNVTDTASAAASLLMDLQIGGASRFRVSKAGGVLAGNGSGSEMSFGFASEISTGFYLPGTSVIGFAITGTAKIGITSSVVRLESSQGFGWSSGSPILTNIDTSLFRDAADTLAQRRGVNAQTFRLYNTFTDASNFERGKMEWASNTLRIGTEKAGTGTARALEFQTNGVTRMTIASDGSRIGVGVAVVPAGISIACDGGIVCANGFASLSSVTFNGQTSASLTSARNVVIRAASTYQIVMDNLPTSNPAVAGALWNNAGVLSVSAG